MYEPIKTEKFEIESLPVWEYLTELKISFLPSPTPRMRLQVRLAFSIRYFESSRDFLSFQTTSNAITHLQGSRMTSFDLIENDPDQIEGHLGANK